MKRIVCLALTLIGSVSGFAQMVIGITTDKTASLVFPFAIRHVDRGTPTVLAQHLEETPTVLLVKAAEKNFTETNLSVVTEDGSVYSFTVCFNPQPATWVHYVPANKSATIAGYAKAILDNPATVKRIKFSSGDVRFALEGIYIKDEVVFYQFAITNQSPIEYDVDLLRFFVKDQHKSKRTAVQAVTYAPLHVAGNASKVKAFGKSTVVIALEKFTIPDKKLLFVQMNERNGGRHLLLRVTNRTLLKGIVLPEMH